MLHQILDNQTLSLAQRAPMWVAGPEAGAGKVDLSLVCLSGPFAKMLTLPPTFLLVMSSQSTEPVRWNLDRGEWIISDSEQPRGTGPVLALTKKNRLAARENSLGLYFCYRSKIGSR